MTSDKVIAYTEEYKDSCKHAWYSAGRPSSGKVWLDITPFDSIGRKPSLTVLRKWRSEQEWDLWADPLDVKALAVVEDDLVAKKVQMFKRHAEQAIQLIESGSDYLKEHGHDSSASAVTAIVKGIQLERESVGGAEMSVKLASMDNSEIIDELKKTLQRAIDSGELESVINITPEDSKDDDITKIDADT